jgi:hypothetical protein
MRFAWGFLLLLLGATLAGCGGGTPADSTAAGGGDKYQGYIELGGGVHF